METGFLVIHPGALGDVLQAVPALRGLRAAAPAAPITFVGQPRLARLLVDLGAAQHARTFDGFGLEALFVDAPTPPALAEAVSRVKNVVSWFGSRDETYRRRLRALAPRALVAPPVPDDDTPVWRHLLGTLAGWDLAIPERVEPLRAPPLPASDAAADAGRPRLVVHPGSGGDWKRWPAERFAEVIRALRRRRAFEVLVHQGPADAEPAQRLLTLLEGDAAVLLQPELTRLAAVLGAARAYLGGDSGVSHLAAAVGTPSVVLFPSATYRRWTPWSPTAIPVEIQGMDGDVARALEALALVLA
ncbi:MAG TPA: glycosyltransferase family 9 protein [Methylomirabilota bacterium]|nr:glycosyltransferase family 9 protein [Methylomirabilota bacterium]